MTSFDDPRLTAIGLLVEVQAGLMDKLSPALAESRLSEVDFETLIRLGRSPEQKLRMSDLAAQTSLSTSGVTRVVDRLEREGLVKRVACASDRRASYATLTADGLARLEGVIPRHVQDIETWFTGLLTPEQLDTLLGTLRVIRDVVRPCATAGAAEAARATACAPAATVPDQAGARKTIPNQAGPDERLRSKA
ncbi:MarR family transcriptional regulator [Sphaerisporangium sp. TRM90804]|uniref:MarR family winged helix-turn-helix transcriptional regulator n=1 Tax=Sphaerisporangium sp. TRM90804 TaxID=3031113 RepID=UPI00244B7CBC|nr:MarR family transcriptional regulator [Sphaerisporangium sp. TRM90804]MDH2425723.1 MarR family transcriptional regulator [Sphaerisporangium sp. TRM90804]